MKSFFLLCLFVLWSSLAFGDDTVTLKEPKTLTVYGFTNTEFLIYSDPLTGQPATEAAPAKIYIPMDGPATSAGSLINYFSIPAVSALFDSVTSSRVVRFPLYINVSATTMYLYAAVKKPSDAAGTYTIVKRYANSLVNQVNTEINFEISPADICGSLPSECTFGGASNTEKNYMLYFFLASTGGWTGGNTTSVQVSSYPDGVYFQACMSNRVYDDTPQDVHVVITNPRSGDGRAIMNFTSDILITNPQSVRVYQQVGSATGGLPLRSYTQGTLLSNVSTYKQNGEVTINGLVNSTTYNLSVFFTDKYNFGTTLSDSAAFSPQKIQELLKKEGCFLLTAGFGEEHYVIDYFRHFRDTVLSKSYLGRQFVRIYYDQAPKYALAIYSHETIRAGIRALAYTLYFIFNYIGFTMCILALGILFLYLFKKREKIKI